MAASTASLHHSLSQLTPAIEILQGFNHRHKNQHRLSRWWAPFDMLRRQARRLERELKAHLDVCEEEAPRALPRGRKPPRQSPSSRRSRGDTAAAATTRAAHVRAHLVPRAFLAFTQLGADNQFAPLGLVLLAVLAQVHDAVRGIAPSEAVPALAADGAGKGTSRGPLQQRHLDGSGVAVSRAHMTTAPSSEPGERSRKDEAGTVTARLASRANEDANGEKADGDREMQPSGHDKGAAGSSQPTKGKKRTGDEFDDIFDSLAAAAPGKKSTKKSTKKSKKKDEFDDWFRSLT